MQMEVDIMKRVRGHPHVVNLYQYLEDKGSIYLAMEWCRGGDLMKYVYNYKHFSEKVNDNEWGLGLACPLPLLVGVDPPNVTLLSVTRRQQHYLHKCWWVSSTCMNKASCTAT